ncbi:hypothetical protein DVH24_005604, partial [Malus domestica]
AVSHSRFLVPHGFRLAPQQLNHYRNHHSSGLYFDCIVSVFVSISISAGSLIPAASAPVKPQKTPEVNFLKLGFNFVGLGSAPRVAAQEIKMSRFSETEAVVFPSLWILGDIYVAIKGFTNEQKAIENGILSEELEEEEMANGEEKSSDFYAVLGLEKKCTDSELRWLIFVAVIELSYKFRLNAGLNEERHYLTELFPRPRPST